MLVGTGAAQVALTALLALNAFRDEPHIWVLFVVAPFLVSAGHCSGRARRRCCPARSVTTNCPQPTHSNALGWQTGSLLGPTIGGLIVASAGRVGASRSTSWASRSPCSLYARMSAFPHREQTTPPSLRGIAEGVRYAISRKDLLGTYFVDVAVMFLAMPIVLFPALAETIFARPHLLGLLYTSETVGALVASALSGWHRRIHSYGRVIVIAACGYGGSSPRRAGP